MNKDMESKMIDINKVVSVYSGRHGCCCGCKGDHVKAEENPAAVKRIVNKLNTLIDWNDPAQVRKYDEGSLVWFDTKSRSYIAYLTS